MALITYRKMAPVVMGTLIVAFLVGLWLGYSDWKNESWVALAVQVCCNVAYVITFKSLRSTTKESDRLDAEAARLKAKFEEEFPDFKGE